MSLSAIKQKLAEIAVRSADAASPVPLAVDTAHAVRGTDLDVTVPPERVTDAARVLDEAAFMLESITGVDFIAEGQMEVVYDYTFTASGERVAIRARVPRAKPELPTVCGIHPGANWHERETHDFFGIVFTGHPDLIPLLLPEDADFHPLRKDYGA
ncbi:MAG: hypothetical protein A3K19_22030 [Lentisphaerae bacterium RIFOXYB12_FULL_65_16]|nr:MAG: hypothetical protein A3K18_04220 [Lentisphaerae bacterium RIFOXYA12_64_32]OGV93936.1 MAG: hypothetical protein A3K19_22030 [Lentisphaerae bacterium RIFOXYB12_FULL_65_16]